MKKHEKSNLQFFDFQIGKSYFRYFRKFVMQGENPAARAFLAHAQKSNITFSEIFVDNQYFSYLKNVKRAKSVCFFRKSVVFSQNSERF